MQRSYLILFIFICICSMIGWYVYSQKKPGEHVGWNQMSTKTGNQDNHLTPQNSQKNQIPASITAEMVSSSTNMIPSSVGFLPFLFPTIDDCLKIFGQDKKDICEKAILWNQALRTQNPDVLTDTADREFMQVLLRNGCVVGNICFNENIGVDRAPLSAVDIPTSEAKLGIYPLFGSTQLSSEAYKSIVLDNLIFTYALMYPNTGVCDRIANVDLKKACHASMGTPSQKDKEYYLDLIKQHGSK